MKANIFKKRNMVRDRGELMLLLINENNVGAGILLHYEITYLLQHAALTHHTLAGDYLYQALADIRLYSVNIQRPLNVVFHASILSYDLANIILFVNYT